jgi:hypothetical protein
MVDFKRLNEQCCCMFVMRMFCLSEDVIAATDDEKLVGDERLNELASEEYKSCIVPFVSQRGKHASKEHPPDRYACVM